MPPKAGITQSSHMASIIRAYRKAGFSKDAAERMSKSVQTSTRRVNQSKWQNFSDWCHEWSTDPKKADISEVADFLIHLSTVEKFTVPTLRGYRSAIALVLKAKFTDVTNSPELAALLRSLAVEIPRDTFKTPKWDPALVLASLAEKPYEPIESADLKYLKPQVRVSTSLSFS